MSISKRKDLLISIKTEARRYPKVSDFLDRLMDGDTSVRTVSKASFMPAV